MRLWDKNWQMVEDYLRHDDRVVIPIGSTEQHGFLSLGTDAMLAERVAVEAAEPLGIPVLPVLSFGITPYHTAFQGTITLRLDTMLAAVRDILDSLEAQGFRRFLVVNGHGGNTPVHEATREWASRPRSERVQVQFTSWYAGPRVQELAQSYEANPSQGGWFENFPWNRPDGVETPAEAKPVVDKNAIVQMGPADLRAATIDGSFGGSYARDDAEMLHIWRTGVEETRDLMTKGWAF